MDKRRVRVYLDDNPKPIIDRDLPTDVTLDTRGLEDGPHRLPIRAQGQSGPEGVEEIAFQVPTAASPRHRSSSERGPPSIAMVAAGVENARLDQSRFADSLRRRVRVASEG